MVAETDAPLRTMTVAMAVLELDLSGRPVVVRYALRDAQLFRTVSGPLGERDQAILNGVRSLGWTYHQRGLGWSPDPPPSPARRGRNAGTRRRRW